MFQRKRQRKTKTKVSDSDPQSKTILLSKSYRPCLTPCHKKDSIYLHPVFMTPVSNSDNPTCAIDPYNYDYDAAAPGEPNLLILDVCDLDDNKTHQLPDELNSSLLSFSISPENFLISLYNIASMDEVIIWSQNNRNLPFNTIKRVHNNGWKRYGIFPDQITDAVIEYYHWLTITYWLTQFIPEILTRYSFQLETDESQQTLTQIISDTIKQEILTKDFVRDVIMLYIEENKNIWQEIRSHYLNLKIEMFYSLVDILNEKSWIQSNK